MKVTKIQIIHTLDDDYVIYIEWSDGSYGSINRTVPAEHYMDGSLSPERAQVVVDQLHAEFPDAQVLPIDEQYRPW